MWRWGACAAGWRSAGALERHTRLLKKLSDHFRDVGAARSLIAKPRYHVFYQRSGFQWHLELPFRARRPACMSLTARSMAEAISSPLNALRTVCLKTLLSPILDVITSMSTRGSIPDFAPIANPSQAPTKLMNIIRLLTNLVTWVRRPPDPCEPHSCRSFASRVGSDRILLFLPRQTR